MDWERGYQLSCPKPEAREQRDSFNSLASDRSEPAEPPATLS